MTDKRNNERSDLGAQRTKEHDEMKWVDMETIARQMGLSEVYTTKVDTQKPAKPPSTK